MDEMTYLILKVDGILRPMAGVWRNDEYGWQSAQEAARGADVVVVTITEATS